MVTFRPDSTGLNHALACDLTQKPVEEHINKALLRKETKFINDEIYMYILTCVCTNAAYISLMYKSKICQGFIGKSMSGLLV